MKKIILILILLLVGGGILMPIINTQAALTIMNKGACLDTGDCNFCDVMQVIYNVGKFIFSAMAGVAMILFLWAGTGLIINWGNAEMITANKKLLVNTVIGIVIILLAWVLVDALINLALGAPESSFLGGNWFTGPACK